MAKVIVTGRRSRLLMAAALGLACSGGGGGGPAGGENPPAVAGNYNATFTATQATGCQGFVTAPSSTTGTLRVSQSGSSVTLHITDLRPEFRSNPTGTLSANGVFTWGPDIIVLDPTPDDSEDRFNAEGMFSGSFSGSSLDITFDFTALELCNVVGMITGTRS